MSLGKSKYIWPAIAIGLPALIWWCLIPTGSVMAQTVAELDSNYTYIVDSLTTTGSFARPRICPQDSTWIAYERRTDSTADIICSNTITGERRSLREVIEISSAERNVPATIRAVHGFSWRPVKTGRSMWAAFVGVEQSRAVLVFYNLTDNMVFYAAHEGDSAIETLAGIVGPPEWSPDGSCLAFSVLNKGHIRLHIACGLGGALQVPDGDYIVLNERQIEVTDGDVFDPVWCPMAGTGYIALVEQSDRTARYRINIYDPLTSRVFGLTQVDFTCDYFGVEWSQSGRRLSYFQHWGPGDPLFGDEDQFEDTYGVGIADITRIGDSLAIIPVGPATQDSAVITHVLPNIDRYTGPAWLPGGRQFLVSIYSEPQPTRLGMVSPPDKTADDKTAEYWFRPLGSGRFLYARDMTARNRNLAFSFGTKSHAYLLTGHLVPNLAFITTPDNLDIAESRRIWWENYSMGQMDTPGALTKIANFLWSPIAGPDIGINKRIVPIVGGAVALAMVLGGSGDNGGGTTDGRDWRPPEFPDGTPKRIGFKMTTGF